MTPNRWTGTAVTGAAPIIDELWTDGIGHLRFGLIKALGQMRFGPLGNLPVLAESAAQIAAHSGNRIGNGPRIEVKQRLLLNRVHLPHHELVVDQGIELPRMVVAHTAGPTRTLVDTAVVRAQCAQQPTVRQRLVEASLV